ncbi:type II secretion system protein N [Alcanivorax sp.]|uniref:type II secretion system protein N n=1 Tax=Alcanivorax sp. TaxID=1872427 RepID=UPI0025C2BE12|nr:type II secretion system protein N [Alcanivorax sp.]
MKSQLSEMGKWGKPVRGVIAVVLVVALAWLLAETVWLLMYGPNQPIPESDRTRLQVSGARQSDSLSQNQVDGWQLFGEYQAVAAPKDDTPTDAPETRLRLELLGVFQSPVPELSSAIIAEKGKEGELYHIGDSIPGNASLEEVYPDRVILRRAGRLEALRWSDTALGGVSEVSPPARSRQSPSPVVQEGGPDDMARQRKTIISQLALTPVSQGSNQGYKLGKRAPKQLISQVGLKTDDVILSVNGHGLGTEDGDIAALESFKQTQQATIVVQRGDQQFTVNYPP